MVGKTEVGETGSESNNLEQQKKKNHQSPVSVCGLIALVIYSIKKLIIVFYAFQAS